MITMNREIDYMKFSILIPVYNDEKYIKKTLLSALNQTYEKIEIIIINDGSTDNSGNIINQIAKTDNRIRVINQENRGICYTRDKLINEMKGDYAIFLDGDDFIEEDCCEILNNVLKENDVDLITFDYNIIYLDGIVSKSKNDSQITKIKGDKAAIEFLYQNPFYDMVLWRRCYSKWLLKNIKFKDNFIPEDYYTAFRIYNLAKNVVHISKILYNYRARRNSLSKRKNFAELYNNFLVLKDVNNFELKYLKNRSDKKRANTTYANAMMDIYSQIYDLDEIINKNLIKEIKNAIFSMNIIEVENRTRLLLIMFRIDKKLVCKILKSHRRKKFKRRNS